MEPFLLFIALPLSVEIGIREKARAEVHHFPRRAMQDRKEIASAPSPFLTKSGPSSQVSAYSSFPDVVPVTGSVVIPYTSSFNFSLIQKETIRTSLCATGYTPRSCRYRRRSKRPLPY